MAREKQHEEAGNPAEEAEELMREAVEAITDIHASQTASPATGASTAQPALPGPSRDDAELEAAALALDQHCRLLRRDLLSRLMDWKRRAGEQKAAMEAASSKSAAEVVELQRKLQAAAAHTNKQQEVQRRMGHLLFRSVLWRRHHTLACTVWRAWRAHTQRWVAARLAELLTWAGGLNGAHCYQITHAPE